MKMGTEAVQMSELQGTQTLSPIPHPKKLINGSCPLVTVNKVNFHKDLVTNSPLINYELSSKNADTDQNLNLKYCFIQESQQE